MREEERKIVEGDRMRERDGGERDGERKRGREKDRERRE